MIYRNRLTFKNPLNHATDPLCLPGLMKTDRTLEVIRVLFR